MAATRRSHDGDGDRASVEEGYFARKSVLRRWSTRQGAKDSDSDSDSGGRPSRRKENSDSDRDSDSDNDDMCLYCKATDGHWKRECPVFKREDPKGFKKYKQKLEQRSQRKSKKKQALPA